VKFRQRLLLKQQKNQCAGTREKKGNDNTINQTEVRLFRVVRRNNGRFDVIAALSACFENDRTHGLSLSKPRASSTGLPATGFTRA